MSAFDRKLLELFCAVLTTTVLHNDMPIQLCEQVLQSTV